MHFRSARNRVHNRGTEVIWMGAVHDRSAPEQAVAIRTGENAQEFSADLALALKELVLPDGERRPYSLRLAGECPRALDGLCKVLSYDMRVIDPAWIGAKLRTLVDFPEAQGDFMAWVPDAPYQALQPSTVAYIARLMIHRYQQFGILDAQGFPMQAMQVMFTESGVEAYSENVVPLHAAANAATTP